MKEENTIDRLIKKLTERKIETQIMIANTQINVRNTEYYNDLLKIEEQLYLLIERLKRGFNNELRGV